MPIHFRKRTIKEANPLFTRSILPETQPLTASCSHKDSIVPDFSDDYMVFGAGVTDEITRLHESGIFSAKELWQIVGDEIFWHPSVIDEIKKRSRQSHLNLKKLKTAKELFASI